MDKKTLAKLEALIRNYKKNVALAQTKMDEVEAIVAKVKREMKAKKSKKTGR